MWFRVLVKLLARSCAYGLVAGLGGGLLGLLLGLPCAIFNVWVTEGDVGDFEHMGWGLATGGVAGSVGSGILYAAVSCFLPANDQGAYFLKSRQHFGCGMVAGLTYAMIILLVWYFAFSVNLGYPGVGYISAIQGAGMMAGGISGLITFGLRQKRASSHSE